LSRDPAAWRAENIGRIMFAATDRFVREKARIVEDSGFSISEAQVALFKNLDREGTRLTRLAARANLTKPSMVELIDRAEGLGFVARRPDPDDGRAKIVVFTPRGLRVLDRLREGVLEAERRMAASIGRPLLASLKQGLIDYSRAVGAAPPEDDLRMADDNAAWRSRNIGRILSIASSLFARQVLGVVRNEGFDRVTEVQLTLFRLLDLDGTRLTELAARARMTKQAMIELVDKAEQGGFVERRPDPADGRAKILAFTASGLHLLDSAHRGVVQAEQNMALIAGADFVADLRARLGAYVRDGEAAPADAAERAKAPC
jgi:DNA-binding MarR family transcriptional regulator